MTQWCVQSVRDMVKNGQIYFWVGGCMMWVDDDKYVGKTLRIKEVRVSCGVSIWEKISEVV